MKKKLHNNKLLAQITHLKIMSFKMFDIYTKLIKMCNDLLINYNIRDFNGN